MTAKRFEWNWLLDFPPVNLHNANLLYFRPRKSEKAKTYPPESSKAGAVSINPTYLARRTDG